MSENQDTNTATANRNQTEEKTIRVKEDYQASLQEVSNFLQRILDKIASRFVKTYLPPLENSNEETQYFIPVEFYERKNKLPVPEHKVVVIFKIMRNLKKEGVFFQIENE